MRAVKAFVLDSLFAFPDPQRYWLGPAVRQGSILCAGDRPDLIFATGKPWTALLVGRALAKKFQIPLISDFRDPWGGNPRDRVLGTNHNGRFSTPMLGHRDAKLEEALCGFSSRIITTTEELRQVMSQKFPEFRDKIITITNGFDGEALDSDSATESGAGHSARKATSLPIEFSHFGQVYSHSPPTLLLQAMKELYEENLIRGEQLIVRFVGKWNKGASDGLVAQLEEYGMVRRENPIPRKLCLQRMKEAQYLLLLTQGPLQIPAKLYEYVHAGRPIFEIGAGATAELVNRHRLGLCGPTNLRDMKDLLIRVVMGQTRIDPPEPSEVSQFDFRSLSGDLAMVFDDVVGTAPCNTV